MEDPAAVIGWLSTLPPTHELVLKTMTIDEHVGARLRKLRVERGVPPQKLAILLSIPVESYFDFETGRAAIPARLLIDLSMQLDVSVKYFIDGFDVDQHRKGTDRADSRARDQ